MNKNQLYRRIPKVDSLLKEERIRTQIRSCGKEPVMKAIHEETDELRAFIEDHEEDEEAVETRIAEMIPHIEERVEKDTQMNMRPVINGTGTILHTNLGRAPLNHHQAERMADMMTGYSNLEYDLDSGKRGERYAHFEQLLKEITDAEAAMAVNNNAAAVLLVLSSLSEGGEVIVSRGELVEIGGKFRIPDVLEQSGAVLKEVGTTNKTHPEDYENAIGEHTKAILKVHTSNYSIVGFTESVGTAKLSEIAKAHDLPLIEDLGSGVFVDLRKYGLTYEPTVQDVLKEGADIVCFSGDKLLGGPQAGIILGKEAYIARMKKNPLTRALRIDKYTAGALEMVLHEYRSEPEAVEHIPVLRMITQPYETVEGEAEDLCGLLKEEDLLADIETQESEAQIGGGSLPLERIKSRAVAIKPKEKSVSALEEEMRRLPVPIIPRVAKDQILLDARTIFPGQHALIADELKSLIGGEFKG